VTVNLFVHGIPKMYIRVPNTRDVDVSLVFNGVYGWR